jgi:hypothetical protein
VLAITAAHPKGVSGVLLAQAIAEQIRGPNELAKLTKLLANTLAWCKVWAEDWKHAPDLLRWLRQGGWLKPPPATKNGNGVAPPKDVVDYLLDQAGELHQALQKPKGARGR